MKRKPFSQSQHALPDARRRLINTALLGVPLLAGGCDTLQTVHNKLKDMGVPGVPGKMEPIPVEPTYAFPSGARMWVIQRGALTIHSYVAPESAYGGAAQVIELASQLFIYDTTGSPALGRELRQYANTLRKPITRVLFSHEHYEQWFGWPEFAELPTYAPRETEAFFLSPAARSMLRPGVVLPKLTGVMAPGDERIDGVLMQTRLARDTEATNVAMLMFPEQRVLVTGDLVYSGRHAYLGHMQWERWSNALAELPNWVDANTLVLPGHGGPTTGLAVPVMRKYLAFAIDVLGRSRTAQDAEAAFRAEYPSYGGIELLEQGLAAVKRR